MQKIIIDGYNLIYAHPELKKKIESEAEGVREILVSILAEYLRTRKEKVVVVFDSAERGVVYKSPRPSRLQVRFSKPGLSADQMIVGMMRSEPRPQKLTVVSSDYKDIGAVANSLGVELLSAETFWERLTKRKRGAAKEAEKPTSVSPREIEYWLREFQTGKDRSEDG